MNDNVKPFPYLCAYVSCNADVARELRRLAALIEKDEYGDVRGVVACIEAEGQIRRYTAGPKDGYSHMEVAGLLSYALNNLINP